MSDPTQDTAAAPAAPPAAAPAAPAPADPPAAAPAPTPAPAPAPAEAPKPQPKAPEQYAAFEVPAELREDAIDFGAFNNVAKELDLSQEAAQKLVSFQAQSILRERTAWAEASKADAEFGGAKLDENMAVAKKAIETFGTPELRQMLNKTGLGNHPEVIRAFYRAGKAISDDKIITGNAAPQRDDAKRFYPQSNMN